MRAAYTAAKTALVTLALTLPAGAALAQTYGAPPFTSASTAAVTGATASPGYADTSPAPRADVAVTGSVGHRGTGHAPARRR